MNTFELSEKEILEIGVQLAESENELDSAKILVAYDLPLDLFEGHYTHIIGWELKAAMKDDGELFPSLDIAGTFIEVKCEDCNAEILTIVPLGWGPLKRIKRDE